MEFAVSWLFLPLSQLSRGRQGQISTPPALASCTFRLLLRETSFSWWQKRSETCTQRAGGAEQHVEQAAAPQRREAQRHRAALGTAGPSPLPLSPKRLHRPPAPPLPCQDTRPTAISLFVLRSGFSRCLTSHLHMSLQASDTDRLKSWVSGREASPCLWTHFQGQPATSGKGKGALLLPPAQPSSAVGKCTNKIILLYH